ncbi:MAG: hypothetical protein ACJAZH_001296, partial [Roseivirga sp.]
MRLLVILFLSFSAVHAQDLKAYQIYNS